MVETALTTASVIASAAKQSSSALVMNAELDCRVASLLAMTVLVSAPLAT
jgi:hypothetical protein